MNPFIPALILTEIGIFLTFTRIILNARRNKAFLGWLAVMVMYEIAFLFNLAIQLFYAGFSI